ncbi:hypothetical protein D3C73_1657450 [compost metagenome]
MIAVHPGFNVLDAFHARSTCDRAAQIQQFILIEAVSQPVGRIPENIPRRLADQ